MDLIPNPYSIASPKPILGGKQNNIFFPSFDILILSSNL